MPGPAMAPLPRGARMVPSSITRQTEGGIDPNSPAGQAYTGSYEGELRALGAKQEAQRSYYDQMATAADAQAAQNRADQAAAEQQAREAEAKKQALITERDRQLGAANTIVQQQSDRTVDPNRIFRGNNGNRLIAGLAVALGGLGQGLLTSAGISGARNVGLDMLNNAIDTDIQSQREEIARGNVKAQNDLKRIQDQYGVDIDEASKILKVANLDITASKAAALAAQNQSANAKAQAAVIMAGIEQEKAKTVREMTAGLIGKQTTVENIRVQMPQGPGDVELAQARRAAQLAGYESTVAKSGADIARAQYMATHGGAEPPKPEDQGKDEQELAGKLATDPAVRAKEALAGYAQSRGMVQQGNGWAEGEDKLVTGANPLAHVPYTDTSRAYADQQGRLELVTEMWGRMQSGGVISPDENKRFQEQLSDLSSRDPKVAAAALTRIDQMVSAKAQALEAGYSPETVATVKGRMAPKKAETKGLQSFRSR